MYIFKGRGVFINVYKADGTVVTSGTTLLSDLDLQETYRAIDSVATGRIPSLSCADRICWLRNKKDCSVIVLFTD